MLWCYSLPMISRVLLPFRALGGFKNCLVVASVVCTASLGAGCSSEGDDDGAAGSGGTGGGTTNAVTIPITDANQYTSEATLDIPSIEVVAENITIGWSGVSSDLQCNDVDVSDLVNVSFLRFEGMTEEEVAEELTKSRIDSNKAKFFDYRIKAGELTVELEAFEKLGGVPIDIDSDFKIDAETAYLIIVQDQLGLGVGTKSMTFVRPSDEGTDLVELGTGCPSPPILTFDAFLADKPTISVPAEAPWIVGWRDVTKDGTGGELALADTDQLLIGFYPDMSPSDLETEFFDIETLAEPMWELAVEGPDLKADLSNAVKRNADGTPSLEKFSGFDQQGEGTWMVALTCSVCANPQPVILAILEPSEG
jgi:hypothetical protein